MGKKISNIIICMNDYMKAYDDVDSKNDPSFEKFANFIKTINENDSDIKIYFLIDNINIDNKNEQKENIKNFLKEFKIKIKENNIYFLTKKDSDDNLIVYSSLDEIIDYNNSISFNKEDTIMIFSDINFGELSYLDGFYTIMIYSQIDEINVKNFNKECICNNKINLDEDSINIDSIKYDFISFLESNNN